MRDMPVAREGTGFPCEKPGQDEENNGDEKGSCEAYADEVDGIFIFLRQYNRPIVVAEMGTDMIVAIDT